MGSGSWAGDPSRGEDPGPGRGWPWGSAPGEDPAHLCTLLEQEKSQLEERLLQTMTTMQQLEAELQAFQKSCLLQLARSSWVGRILRSSTGSVEVSPTRPTLLPPVSPSPTLLGHPLGSQCLSFRCFCWGEGGWPAWEACLPSGPRGREEPPGSAKWTPSKCVSQVLVRGERVSPSPCPLASTPPCRW